MIGITAYTEPVTIYQFQPHAHLRGKDFKYAVVYPDGREETVLSVPKYDFHWQLAYELETPLKLPAGSKLVVTAHYDNSQRTMRTTPATRKRKCTFAARTRAGMRCSLRLSNTPSTARIRQLISPRWRVVWNKVPRKRGC